MQAANPKADVEPAILSAEIRPHRSLSQRGFLLVMSAIGGLSFVAGTIFFMMGAWPVIGFFGLDVALVWWAFRANYRAARAREVVRVTGSEILVRRVGQRGAVAEWRFNPYWARILVEREEDGVNRLSLASHGKRLEIANWLSPLEKADFADALAGALAAARRVPSAD